MEKKNEKVFNMLDNLNISDSDILKSIEISRSIAGALDRAKLLNMLRAIVDESSCISFKSNRAKNFIDASRPELRLTMDIKKAKKLYPDLDFDSTVPEEQHDIRKSVTQAEVSNKIVDFFTATFLYIKTNEYPEHFADAKDKVLEITKNVDIVKLRSTINNFYKISSELEELEELGFSFAVTSVTSFPPNEDILNDPSVYLEIVY